MDKSTSGMFQEEIDQTQRSFCGAQRPIPDRASNQPESTASAKGMSRHGYGAENDDGDDDNGKSENDKHGRVDGDDPRSDGLWAESLGDSSQTSVRSRGCLNSNPLAPSPQGGHVSGERTNSLPSINRTNSRYKPRHNNNGNGVEQLHRASMRARLARSFIAGYEAAELSSLVGKVIDHVYFKDNSIAWLVTWTCTGCGPNNGLVRGVASTECVLQNYEALQDYLAMLKVKDKVGLNRLAAQCETISMMLK